MLKRLKTLQTRISVKLKQPQHKNDKKLDRQYSVITKRLNDLKERHQKNIATIKQNYTKISQGLSKTKN